MLFSPFHKFKLFSPVSKLPRQNWFISKYNIKKSLPSPKVAHWHCWLEEPKRGKGVQIFPCIQYSKWNLLISDNHTKELEDIYTHVFSDPHSFQIILTEFLQPWKKSNIKRQKLNPKAKLCNVLKHYLIQQPQDQNIPSCLWILASVCEWVDWFFVDI